MRNCKFPQLGGVDVSPTPLPAAATEFRLRLDDSGAPIKVSVKESSKGSWYVIFIMFVITSEF